MLNLLILFFLSLPQPAQSTELHNRMEMCTLLADSIAENIELLNYKLLTYDMLSVRTAIDHLPDHIRVYNLYCTEYADPIPPYKIPIRFTL